MSKRQSGGSNTLFNYFTKSPSVNNSPSASNGTPKKIPKIPNETPKKVKEKRQYDNDDDDVVQVRKRKRIRVADTDSESDEENRPINEPQPASSKLKEYEATTTPSKLSGSDAKKAPNTPKNEAKSSTSKQNTATSFGISDSPSSNKNSNASEVYNDDEIWLHNRLEFLKLNKIKDKLLRRPDNPDYDPRTLHIPNDFITKQTPAMRQWWELKTDHFDCVFFFKVGKFYELYHMDAVIGVKELGFSYMKGEFAHSGFPESAYGRMSASLIELGYKVARVEQTESTDAMAERLKSSTNAGKQSKVVSREICQISNRATRIHAVQDIDIKEATPNYLYSIMEAKDNDVREFGVCFVDTSLGIFHIGQFVDDLRFSRLLTMFAEFPPAVVLEERKQLSTETRSLLKSSHFQLVIEGLGKNQFYSQAATLEKLIEGSYFKDDELPEVIQKLYDSNVSDGKFDLAIRCLGACLWYLKDCLLDLDVVAMGQFMMYAPSDLKTQAMPMPRFMVLDSYSLSGLNILGSADSLEKTMDYCKTPFGKRLFHQWICRPVCDVQEIEDRQEAITELIGRPVLMEAIKKILCKMPDLERLLSKIHHLGNPLRIKKNHPDSRAILYEEKTYSKKKVTDFITTLNGFVKAKEICRHFDNVHSKMLIKHVCETPTGIYPDVEPILFNLQNSFNAVEAAKEGKIIPERGANAAYDQTIDAIAAVNAKLDTYLREQEKFFGCKLAYFGTDKKRYQIEVPESATHKANHNYSLEGSKKGSKPTKRYSTIKTREYLAEMMAAESFNRSVIQDMNRSIFEMFSQSYEAWSTICYCIAVVDALVSLADYVKNQNTEMCIPKVLPFDDNPHLLITNGIHPCVNNIENYVANDTELGTESHPNLLILTGPNMGGKSTHMRQVALLTIMAQMGCHVPASSMTFTLVDRIFTRLGAHDDIIAGHSTFWVELNEASTILQHSTRHSLVFLDELGRGTATFDGTAIATAYVYRLIESQCRTIFSTHYYNLLEYLKNNNNIQLAHMACKVESDDNATEETVIFMYKMVPGACPKSYGFNAARLAGMPSSITQRARIISRRLEMETIARQTFRKLFCTSDDGDLLEILARQLERQVAV